MFHWFTV